MVESLGYLGRFDRCFFSFEVGLAKPDPLYFRFILDALGLEGGAALFLDDRERNVEAARSVGMKAERFVNAQDGRAHLQIAEILGRHGVAAA